MPQTRRIALVLSATDIYSHRISAGIGQYADAHEPWDFYLHVGRPHSLAAVAGWPADGIITNIVERGFDQVIARSGITAIAITNRRPEGPLPRVIVDDVAVAKMAAEHLCGCGLRHFAYLGHADLRHGGSAIRGKAFAAAVGDAGGVCRLGRAAEVGGRRTWDAAQDRLARWIADLPRPLGLFAYADFEAWPAVQACRRMGLRVPEDVAVLGATDDPLVTRLATPPLSSIALPLEKLGYEAAALLDRLMRGRKPLAAPVRVLPETVVARRSTELMAVADEDVVRALRYIEANARRAVPVDEVCEAAAASRRTLQRKMQAMLGRTLRGEIRRARIDRAQRLLRETDPAVAQVARQCGFRHVPHFCRVFRNEVGCTPSAYRARYRTGG